MEAIETPTQKIQRLNDSLRQTLIGGRLILSLKVSQLPEDQKQELVNLVMNFKDFTEDNDPHGEHDFGSVNYQGETYFWKIDYYDTNYQFMSPDPSDTEVTRRVLNILHSWVY